MSFRLIIPLFLMFLLLIPRIASSARLMDEGKETISLDGVKRHLLVNDEELEGASQVLKTKGSHRYLSNKSVLFINGVHSKKEWRIYRRSPSFVDGISFLRYVADASLNEVGANYTQLSLTSLSQEVLVGDIVLPIDNGEKENDRLHLEPAPCGSQAKIIKVIDGYYTHLLDDHQVVINLGRNDNIKEGSVFHLIDSSDHLFIKSGEYDVSLDEFNIESGKLVVIKAYASLSLAVVLDSNFPTTRATAVSPELPCSGDVEGDNNG